MARMQETTKQLEQQRKIKVSVRHFYLVWPDLAVRQQDACTNIILVSQQFPSPNNPFPRMADHPLKWVWILEDCSENGCGKWHFLVWNRVRIWRTGWHTPTKNSQQSTGISRPSHLSLFHPNRASLCWLHWNQTCCPWLCHFLGVWGKYWRHEVGQNKSWARREKKNSCCRDSTAPTGNLQLTFT